MSYRLAFTLIAAFAPLAIAQEFEVVSIKPNHSASSRSSTHGNQGGLNAENVSLRSLILTAYGIRDYQLEGPDWLRDQRFDIHARFPEELPKDREKYNQAYQSMMQKMLKDRFKLEIHRDQKVFSVYGLTVGKNGIKFKEVPDGDSHNSRSNDNHYEANCVNMAGFAAFVASRVELPVIDMTGLKGWYELKLDWVPEPQQSTGARDDAPPGSDSPTGPTLLIAIQEQLGLKLETRKAPIEVVLVDHIERTPTEN